MSDRAAGLRRHFGLAVLAAVGTTLVAGAAFQTARKSKPLTHRRPTGR